MGEILGIRSVFDPVNEKDVDIVDIQIDGGGIIEITKIAWNKFESIVV